jgi:hypothetical protein
MTNNQAEYTALIRALEHAERLGREHALVILSDSELLVKQMQGEYRVKNEDLRVLFEQARELSIRFASVKLCHIRRELNKRADQLCNEALDGEGGRAARPVIPRVEKAILSVSQRAPTGRVEAVREEAVSCLRAAAAAWARGNPVVPKPEEVWEQLWSILEESGLLRRLKHP